MPAPPPVLMALIIVTFNTFININEKDWGKCERGVPPEELFSVCPLYFLFVCFKSTIRGLPICQNLMSIFASKNYLQYKI